MFARNALIFTERS